MVADEVDRDFPEQPEILDGIAIPHPAVIFLEGDVNGLITNDKLSFSKAGFSKIPNSTSADGNGSQACSHLAG